MCRTDRINFTERIKIPAGRGGSAEPWEAVDYKKSMAAKMIHY